MDISQHLSTRCSTESIVLQFRCHMYITLQPARRTRLLEFFFGRPPLDHRYKRQYNNHSHLQSIKLNLFFSFLFLKQRYAAQDCPHFKSVNGIAPSCSFNICALLGIFQLSCAVLTLRTPERTTWLSQRTQVAERCTLHMASDGDGHHGRHGPELSGFILWKGWKSTDQSSDLGPRFYGPHAKNKQSG